MQQEISTHEELISGLRASMAKEVTEWLRDAQAPEEVISRAAFAYWEVPEVNASVIAEAVVGDPKAVHRLLKLIPAGQTVVCEEGHEIKIASRSMMAMAYRKGIYCQICMDGANSARWKDHEAQEAQAALRVAELAAMPYLEYLKTPEWQARRADAMRRAKYRCQLCNTQGILNVHHRTYERRGDEWPADLITLCYPCHGKFHDKMPPAA